MERWKPVVGVDGYEISSEGRVRSMDRLLVHTGDKRRRRWKGRFLKPSACQGGYLFVNLGRQRTNAKIHKMMMEAFVGPANGRDIHHVNGDPQDNRLENMEYLSRSQHMAKEPQRRGARGNEHPRTKVRDESIPAVFEMRSRGMTGPEIARLFGVTHGTIYRILHGKRRVSPSV